MANEATEKKTGINALGAKAAYNLANVTKTKPQFGALTPKWLKSLLSRAPKRIWIYLRLFSPCWQQNALWSSY